MRIEFVDVLIDYLDGTSEKVECSTRQYVAEGCLHLFKKNGEYAVEEHLGSWPLTSIRKWTRSPR